MNTARMAPITSIPYIPAPIPPGVISPSSMLNSGTSPARGCRLSWAAVIAPVLVLVVMAANMAPRTDPFRTSEPSMLPRDWSTPAGNSGLPTAWTCIATTAPTRKTAAIAPKIAQPWRRSLAYRPKV